MGKGQVGGGRRAGGQIGSEEQLGRKRVNAGGWQGGEGQVGRKRVKDRRVARG